MRRHALLAAAVLGVCTACGAAETAENPDACPAAIPAGAEGVYSPSWSPEGDEIAFSTISELYVVSLADCRLRRVRPERGDVMVDSVDWSRDGSSFAFVSGPGEGEGLWIMGADGSDPHSLVEGLVLFPAWSPDGRRIAYVEDRVDEVAATEDRNVWVVNADGSGRRRVTTGPWHGSVAWSPDGLWLVSDAASALIRIRPDASGRSVIAGGEHVDPDWSPDGATIVVQGLALVPADGGPVRALDVVQGGAFEPSWSPDGRLITFTDGENEPDLWVADADGGNVRQLISSD